VIFDSIDDSSGCWDEDSDADAVADADVNSDSGSDSGFDSGSDSSSDSNDDNTVIEDRDSLPILVVSSFVCHVTN